MCKAVGSDKLILIKILLVFHLKLIHLLSAHCCLLTVELQFWTKPFDVEFGNFSMAVSIYQELPKKIRLFVLF